MTSCTIIVYHYEGFEFLKACIRKIKQYAHPEIEQKIIITEQSNQECYDKVVAEFDGDPDITVIKMKALWSGYAVDYVMRYGDIKTEYVCGIEPDVFPIHENWLYLCIKLLEEGAFKFVGGLCTISSPEDKIYYHKNCFCWLSQYLRVGRTSDYLELSLEGGFTRYHNRPEVDVPMTWANDDWTQWAKDDYHAKGSDDATVAHCWEDNHKENDKFILGVTRIMDVTGEDRGYGRVTEGIVFHFGFHKTSVGVGVEKMSQKYVDWKKRIDSSGLDDELIEEMLASTISTKDMPHTLGGLHTPGIEHRLVWDGKLKKTFPCPEKINKRIEEILNAN